MKEQIESLNLVAYNLEKAINEVAELYCEMSTNEVEKSKFKSIIDNLISATSQLAYSKKGIILETKKLIEK